MSKSDWTDRAWAYFIGIGIALTPIHNVWFTNLFSNSKGEVIIFLPTYGAVMWIMGSLLYIVKKWGKGDKWQDWLGDWRIFVPPLIIVLFMGISGFLTGNGLEEKVAPLFTGVALFAVYIVSRRLGATLFKPLIPLVILGAVIAVVLGILHQGTPASQTNGLITNYCACAGFLLFGATVNQGKWQWVLVAVALIGVFFIGALESVFVLAVLGLFLLIRKDFNKRLLVVVGVMALLIGLWVVFGHLWNLYKDNGNLQALFNILSGSTPINDTSLRLLTSGRWEIIVRSLQNITFFGHGYTLNLLGGGIVHNIPLIIVYQIGPVAGLAWLFVSMWCLIKTKWKYAWMALLAMSVLDHYFWTQLYPLFFALIGVSTASTIKSDLIFRKVKQ